jgi:sugar phosphate isomerase/epimerase
MKIAVAGWSLHRRFRAPENPLKLMDYPALVRAEFGVDAVELNSPFFASLEAAYLADLKAAVKKAKSRVVHISVDGQGDLAAVDEAVRAEAVKKHLAWFGIAKAVGSPGFRANTGGKAGVNPETIAQCIKSFKELAREGEKTGLNILIENHGGISGDPDLIVRIMEEVASERIGTCPDFGNAPDDTRYQFLEKIMPYAKVCHAKFYEFDAAGEDTKIDAKRCIDIAKKAKFVGYCAIEFEGQGDDLDGVRKSVALLKKYI